MRADLTSVLATCGSGQELIARGYAGDVRHASRLNAYETAPVLRDGERFVAWDGTA
jgi:phosphosulfolactate phosphohydrolase-like enzyme